MNPAFNALLDTIRPLRLDQALLFLNSVMGVLHGQVKSRPLERVLQNTSGQAMTFVVRFLAKQIILHSSVLGRGELDIAGLQKLIELYFELDDPIASAPGWQTADPTGFFLRFLSMQLPAQKQRCIREYGLALGLFREAGTPVSTGDYDLRGDLERELEMTIDEFMSLGFMCAAIRSIPGCPGTFTYNTFADAFALGLQFSTPQTWKPFLRRVACDQDSFRQICTKPEYVVDDDGFEPSAFNPLTRYPVIEVKPGHFIAVDPALLVERTTWGLFYDLFERDRIRFCNRFGDVFARFVGTLLHSVCPDTSLWSDSRSGVRDELPRGKRGDWAYRGSQYTVLFECKSLRPNLELLTYGSERGLNSMTSRIADALEQLSEHDAAIQRGEWSCHGLPPKTTLKVVLTYGEVVTINGPFFRKRLAEAAKARGFAPGSYVVVSLAELDAVIRLVELGESLDRVIRNLTQTESFDILAGYRDKLAANMISGYATKQGRQFLESLNVISSLPPRN